MTFSRGRLSGEPDLRQILGDGIEGGDELGHIVGAKKVAGELAHSSIKASAAAGAWKVMV